MVSRKMRWGRGVNDLTRERWDSLWRKSDAQHGEPEWTNKENQRSRDKVGRVGKSLRSEEKRCPERAAVLAKKKRESPAPGFRANTSPSREAVKHSQSACFLITKQSSTKGGQMSMSPSEEAIQKKKRDWRGATKGRGQGKHSASRSAQNPDLSITFS